MSKITFFFFGSFIRNPGLPPNVNHHPLEVLLPTWSCWLPQASRMRTLGKSTKISSEHRKSVRANCPFQKFATVPCLRDPEYDSTSEIWWLASQDQWLVAYPWLSIPMTMFPGRHVGAVRSVDAIFIFLMAFPEHMDVVCSRLSSGLCWKAKPF